MKKIVAIILEGISDETVLTSGLSQILENDSFHIEIFRGNLLTSDFNSPKSAKALVGDYIKETLLNTRYLKLEDIAYIIQVADIDDVYSNSNLNSYQELHKNRLDILSRTNNILGVPYLLYYMSANLEEVISGRKVCTDEEKEEISNEFAFKYLDDYKGYKNFFDNIINNKFNDYNSSWIYIKNGQSGKMSNLSYFLELIENL